MPDYATNPETRDFKEPKDKKVSGAVHKRLSIAHEVIQDVKKINAHAGNQREALVATKGNAAYRGPLLREEEGRNWRFTNDAARTLADNYPEAFFVAKAELLGAVDAPGVTNAGAGGTCWDQAHLAYYFLRIKAAGHPIAVISSEIDHAFTHIGDHKKEDAEDVAVCDPWPTKATAVPWADHFCNGSKVTTGLNMIADGGGKTGDGTDVKEAIKASLVLTDAGKKFIQTTLTDKEVEKHIESGMSQDFADRVRPDQPVYHHWTHQRTVGQGEEARSMDPNAPGGRYMTEEQIRGAAGGSR